MIKNILFVMGIATLLFSLFIMAIDPTILGNMVSGFFLACSVVIFILADAKGAK